MWTDAGGVVWCSQVMPTLYLLVNPVQAKSIIHSGRVLAMTPAMFQQTAANGLF